MTPSAPDIRSVTSSSATIILPDGMFDLYRREDGDWELLAPFASMQFTDRDVEPGHTYAYSIVDVSGGARSEPAEVKVPELELEVTTDWDEDANAATATITFPSDGMWNVYRTEKGAEPQLIAQVESNEGDDSFLDPDLLPDTAYSYSVAKLDPEGNEGTLSDPVDVTTPKSEESDDLYDEGIDLTDDDLDELGISDLDMNDPDERKLIMSIIRDNIGGTVQDEMVEASSGLHSGEDDADAWYLKVAAVLSAGVTLAGIIGAGGTDEFQTCSIGFSDGDSTVAVDIDGTLASHNHHQKEIGKIRKGARNAMKKLKRWGCKIIIHTVRGDKEQIAKWLNDNNVPYDEINENSDQPEGANHGKPISQVYIDDRAVNADKPWDEIMAKVKDKLGFSVQFDDKNRRNTGCRTEQEMSNQFDFLDGMADAIASGDQSLSGVDGRLGLYAGSLRSITEAVRHVQADAQGAKWARRSLDEALAGRHCQQCIDEAAKGYVPLADFVPIGDCECNSNCGCSAEYSFYDDPEEGDVIPDAEAAEPTETAIGPEEYARRMQERYDFSKDDEFMDMFNE